MPFLKQNNDEFLYYPTIPKYGCRFRCLQAIAEDTCKKYLSPEQIIDMFEFFIKTKAITVMGENCRCGNDEHRIIDKTFEVLGSHKKGRQIGTMIKGLPVGWDSFKTSYHYSIQHFTTNTSDGHFMLYNANDIKIFDPWDYCKGSLAVLNVRRILLYKVRG